MNKQQANYTPPNQQEYDTQSTLSDIISPTPSEPMEDDNDDDPFASSRLQAIFGKGIVVYENRVQPQREISAPDVFVESLLNKHQHTLAHIDESSVQKDFIEGQFKSKADTQKCAFSYDKTKPVSVVQQLSSSLIKGDKEVHFYGRKFILPSIRDNALHQVQSGLLVFIDNLLDELDVNLSLKQGSIDRSMTIKTIKEKASNCLRFLTPNPRRAEVYESLLVASVLEQLVANHRSDLAAFLKTSVLGAQSNEDNSRLFIKTDTKAETVEIRSLSMINESSISAAINVCYNLRFQQIQDLLHYIFSSDQQKDDLQDQSSVFSQT